MKPRFTFNQLKTLAVFQLFECPLNAVMVTNLKKQIFMSHNEGYEKNVSEELEKLAQIRALETVERIEVGWGYSYYYRLTERGLDLMKKRFDDVKNKATRTFENTVDFMRIYLWLYPYLSDHIIRRERSEFLDQYQRYFLDQVNQDEKDLWQYLQESRRTDAQEKLSMSLRKLKESGYSTVPVKEIWPCQTGEWAKNIVGLKCMAEKHYLQSGQGDHLNESYDKYPDPLA